MEVVDLTRIAGHGPAWGTASEDLNATLLVWREGEGQPSHINAERDVALLALAGSGVLLVDEQECGGVRHVRGASLVAAVGRAGGLAVGHGLGIPGVGPARLADGGHSIEQARPVGGRERFFVRDPFGNLIEFVTPRG